jgi:predicted 2-oxoglutarate/Fe(II)-dependent dioxygenase YbiX|tara:strand:+ start:1155 stop:1712 length:558 start_codon:yes stop_codon:yes gene_type:complete
MKDYIYIQDNILDLKSLSYLLKWINTLSFEKAGIKAKGAKESSIDKKVRDVNSHFISRESVSMSAVSWHNYLELVFTTHMKKYMDNHPQLILNNWEAFEILKYDKDHHFELHVDSGPTVPRTMSIIFMLNDDYEGGDLVFRWREDEMIIPKKANQLIFFPSTFCYPHTVKPIKSGTRYSIVTWAL